MSRQLLRRLCLTVWLGLFCAGSASAQSNNWFFHPWQIEDGLPDNIISGIAQTPDGFLWVATAGGLVRFDGDRFQEFSPANIPGVPDRNIRALMTSADGKLWLGNDDGTVISLNSQSASVFTVKEGLPNSRVRI